MQNENSQNVFALQNGEEFPEILEFEKCVSDITSADMTSYPDAKYSKLLVFNGSMICHLMIRIDENGRSYFELLGNESQVVKQLYYDWVKSRILRRNIEFRGNQFHNLDFNINSTQSDG